VIERIICGLVGLVVGAVLISGLLAVTDTSASDLAAATQASDAAKGSAERAAEQSRQRAAQLTGRVTELERLLRERDATIASQTPAARDARAGELEQQVARLESQLAMARNRIKSLEEPPTSSADAFDYADRPRRGVAPSTQPSNAHGGFGFGNVSFRDGAVIGEITNNRPRAFKIATFQMSVYDVDGSLVDVLAIVLSNIDPGETKGFTTYLEGGLPPGGRYKIQFENAIE
jgi:small-conductance mechanosensitive channel